MEININGSIQAYHLAHVIGMLTNSCSLIVRPHFMPTLLYNNHFKISQSIIGHNIKGFSSRYFHSELRLTMQNYKFK